METQVMMVYADILKKNYSCEKMIEATEGYVRVLRAILTPKDVLVSKHIDKVEKLFNNIRVVK